MSSKHLSVFGHRHGPCEVIPTHRRRAAESFGLLATTNAGDLPNGAKGDRMKRTQSLIVTCAWLTLVSCADPFGPTSDDGLQANGPVVMSEAGIALLEGNTLRHGQAKPEVYEVSFWAVRGRATHLTIDYATNGVRIPSTNTNDDDDEDDDDDDDDGHRDYASTSHPFLTFDVPAFALYRRPDGSRIALGDSILIELSIDSSRIRVQLEPSGLEFSRWSRPRLRMWYDRANPDYDNNGVVDQADAEIESTLLRVWYQESSGTPWYGWGAQHSLYDKRFEVYLRHFSNYAVSW